MMRPSQRYEQGAAAVELALVVLPLLLLLLGIVEFSRVFYTRLRLQQAAQQTARQIALHYDDPGITLVALDGLIEDTLDSAVGDLLDASSLIQTIERCDPDPSATGPQDAEVTLRTTLPIALPLDPIPVAGHATMPCEG